MAAAKTSYTQRPWARCIGATPGEDAATLSEKKGFASVLWSSCLATLAVGVNSTAIMAALPSMRSELLLSPAGVEWAVNAYLVVSARSEEHTSELQSLRHLVCRLL